VFLVERVGRVEYTEIVVDAGLLNVGVAACPFDGWRFDVRGADRLPTEVATRLREETSHAIEVARIENEPLQVDPSPVVQNLPPATNNPTRVEPWEARAPAPSGACIVWLARWGCWLLRRTIGKCHQRSTAIPSALETR